MIYDMNYQRIAPANCKESLNDHARTVKINN